MPNEQFSIAKWLENSTGIGSGELDLLKTFGALFAGIVGALALCNALRVYRAQSEQLKIAREKAKIDGRTDEIKRLNESPHFVALDFTEDDGKVDIYSEGDEYPEMESVSRRVIRPEQQWIKGDVVQQVLLIIYNKRKDIEVADLKITLLPKTGDFSRASKFPLRKLYADVQYQNSKGFSAHVVDLTGHMAFDSETIEMEIQFETSKGFEDVHNYQIIKEIIRDENDSHVVRCCLRFRRTEPESLGSGRFRGTHVALSAVEE